MFRSEIYELSLSRTYVTARTLCRTGSSNYGLVFNAKKVAAEFYNEFGNMKVAKGIGTRYSSKLFD